MMSSREHESIPVAQKTPAENTTLVRSNDGEQLPEPLAADMSAQFGVGFKDVRIHRDGAAQAAAKHAGAQAFTRGSDIAFAAGRYNPSSGAGRALLAHELAHVVQQRAGGPAGHAEARAARAGSDVAAGRTVDVAALGGAPVGMQLQPEPEPAPAPEQKQEEPEKAASTDWRTFSHVLPRNIRRTSTTWPSPFRCTRGCWLGARRRSRSSDTPTRWARSHPMKSWVASGPTRCAPRSRRS
jgi:hypothetical protein